LSAIEEAFGADVDYAMLIKLYGGSQDEVRYSPADFVASEKQVVVGKPDREFDFNILCGTPEFDYANVNATLHTIDERAFKED